MKRNTLIVLSAIAAISAVACNKNNTTPEEPTPEPAPTKTREAEFVAIFTDTQLQCIESTFELKVGDETVVVKDSDMKEVTSTTVCPKMRSTASILVQDGERTINYKLMTYDLGSVKVGSKIEGIKLTGTAKSNRPSIDVFDSFNFYGIMLDGKEQVLDAGETVFNNGLLNTDEYIAKFLPVYSKKFNILCSVTSGQ